MKKDGGETPLWVCIGGCRWNTYLQSHNSGKHDITKEQLEHDFFVEALSIYQVAKKHNCSDYPIKRRVKEYGIYLDPSVWGVGTSHYVRKLLIDKVILTPRQISILVGCILGDGCLDGSTRNASLQFSQKYSREGHVEWVRDEFQPFAPKQVYKSTTKGWGKLFSIELETQHDLDNYAISASLWQQFKDNDIPLSDAAVAGDADKLKPKWPDGRWSITDGGKEYLVLKRKDKLSVNGRVTHVNACMYTVRHPEFTRFRSMFYPDGTKIIPKNIGDYLNELALTIWYEGDGSTNHSNGSCTIATCSFTVPECELLLKVLYEKFGIEGQVRMWGGTKEHRLPVLNFNVVDSRCLHEIIDPLMHSAFEYKKT